MDVKAMDDVEAIKQLKARYFRLIDTKDWAGLRDVFTDDVHVDVTADGGGTYDGADAFLAMLEPTLRDVVSVHHGHMPEIELTSPTTATGIWAMEDVLRFDTKRGRSELHGWGHYDETYERTDGTWRIRSLRLTRLRLDITRGDG
jgi:uncharacterized protein (TIGR02246 family)